MNRCTTCVLLVLVLAPVGVACGSTAARSPQLAALSAHAESSTVVPVTSGRGTRDLGSVALSGGVGIDLTCAGSGQATASLAPLGEQVGAVCNGNGSSIAGAVFPQQPNGTADVRIVAAPDTSWTVSIYHPDATLDTVGGR